MKLTEAERKELLIVLAEVRGLIHELIHIQKEANQKTESRSQPQQ